MIRRKLAVLAWNSLWDGVLLSAFLDCEAVCNLQCDTAAENFGPESRLEVTNYHLRGLADEPHRLSEEEAVWLEEHFVAARSLLSNSRFADAAHALWSYRWHARPRAKLAVLWAGVEGLFGIDSELAFRLSLYAARFLHPHDEVKKQKVFANTKKLYKQRSSAVHGAQIKGDPDAAVRESVMLLQELLRRCVENAALPQLDRLAP